MTLDRFVVFAAVARHRNITRASETLHVSQPAVTKQLRALEKDYNAKLYKKIGRGIELTEMGRVLLRDARAILKRCERLREKFAAAPSPTEAEILSVGGSHSPSVHLLPSLLARFKRTHPRAQVNLRTANRLAIERLILNSEVDIALITTPPVSPGIAMEPYRREPMVAFVSPHHPLARNQELTLQEFERVPLIVTKTWQGRDSTDQFLWEVKKTGLNPNIGMRCDSPEAVKEAVSKKMGMGILFKEAIEPEVRKAEFKILKLPVKNFESASFIVYRKDRPLCASAEDFLGLLRRSRPRPTRTKEERNTLMKQRIMETSGTEH